MTTKLGRTTVLWSMNAMTTQLERRTVESECYDYIAGKEDSGEWTP